MTDKNNQVCEIRPNVYCSAIKHCFDKWTACSLKQILLLGLLLHSIKGFAQADEQKWLQIPLEKGWNFFSLPITPDNNDVATFFQHQNLSSLWTYRNGRYQIDNHLIGGTAYWIYMQETGDISFTVSSPFPSPSSPQAQGSGWNMFGVLSARSSPSDSKNSVWSFEQGKLTMPGNMIPGKGYWRFFFEATDIDLGDLSADKDNDTIPDYWEILWRFNYDANTDSSVDPDSDTLDNLAEFLAGTNPLKEDTDGDGLTDGAESYLTRIQSASLRYR